MQAFQGAGRDGWAVAWWISSPNSHLDGRRTKDCLATQPDAVLKAARIEAREIQHGWGYRQIFRPRHHRVGCHPSGAVIDLMAD